MPRGFSGYRRGEGRYCSKPRNFIAVVAEKPKAARRIAEAIATGSIVRCSLYGVPYWIVDVAGGKAIVAPSAGHLFGPHSTSHGFPALDFEWRPIFEFDKGASYLRKYYFMLSKVVPGATLYVNACDFDIEGSVICYKIIEAFGDVSKAKRMKFSTLSKQELRNSFSKLQRLDVEMVEAGMARSEMDWLWGINMSRALMHAARLASRRRVVLSAGRVQSPTLVEAYRRWRDRNLHVPKPSIQIQATLGKGAIRLTARPEGWKPKSLDEARLVRDELKREPTMRVVEHKYTSHKVNPPPAFSLGDLQREASRLFKMPPLKSQNIAESLYLDALISYPRTNSQKLPPTINYRGIIDKLSRGPFSREASELLAETRGILKPVQGRKDDPAHPAIHPTGDPPPPKLGRDESRIYELIVRRFLASFSRPAEIAKVKLILSDARGRLWSAEGVRIVEEGLLKYYQYSRPREQEIPRLEKGALLDIERIYFKVEWHGSPVKLDKTSLVRWMESAGIGTEGTRARILETLYKRGYLRDSKGKTEVTPLGEAVARIILTLIPEISTPDLTRKFESMINEISSGSRSRIDVVNEAKNTVRSLIESFQSRLGQAVSELSEALAEGEPESPCMICGRPSRDGVLCEHHRDALRLLAGSLDEIAAILSSSRHEALKSIVSHKSSCGLWVYEVGQEILRNPSMLGKLESL